MKPWPFLGKPTPAATTAGISAPGRRRWLSFLLLAGLLFAIAQTTTLKASAATAGTAIVNPYSNITGFDSPQFGLKLYAYIDDGDDTLVELSSSGGAWHLTDLSFTAQAGSADTTGIPNIAGFDSPQFQSRQYAFFNTSRQLVEVSFHNGTWTSVNFATLTGAPGPKTTTPIGFDSPQFQSRQYAYVDQQGHLQELSFKLNGDGWHRSDLTALTGAPLALPKTTSDETLTGFDAPMFKSKQYAYIDQQHHLQELTFQNGTWSLADLTTLAHIPSAAGGLTGFQSGSFKSKKYAYIDQQSHVQELAFQNGSWSVTDLTQAAGAPIATTPALASFASSAANGDAYVYGDIQGHERELFLRSNASAWSVADLTVLSASPPSIGPSFTCFSSSLFGSDQCAHVNANRHIEELSFDGSDWHDADLFTQLS